MKIVQIQEDFQIDVGAPMPTILASGLNIFLIFYIDQFDPDWDGSTIHMRTDEDEGVVTVKFDRVHQFKFGGPNDEAISGHPYYNLGLQPYSIQQVIGSDWIEELRKMNSVHPYHSDKPFENAKHFIFFFHDRCFEIVCDEYMIDRKSKSNMKEEIKRVSELL